MANIRINYGAVLNETDRCNKSSSQLNSAAVEIRNKSSLLDNGVKCRNNIANRLNNIQYNVRDISNQIASIKSVCVNGANTYKNVDQNEKFKAMSLDVSKVANISKSNKLFK